MLNPLRGIRQFKQSIRERAVQRATGLLPARDTQPNDVFICGYPKSGNTWVQLMVAGVTHGIDPRVAPDSLVDALVPTDEEQRFYRRFGPVCYFKTHRYPEPRYRRIVYLLRDARDAMMSYRWHLEALRGGPVDFLNVVVTGDGLHPGKWHEHVERYLANPYGAEMITIRYEDLKADAFGQMQRFCEFARIDASAERIRAIVEGASLENMKQRERTQGWDDPNWPKDKPFVRRGQVGSFRDEMPPDVLAALLKDCGPTLERVGYQI